MQASADSVHRQEVESLRQTVTTMQFNVQVGTKKEAKLHKKIYVQKNSENSYFA